MSDQRLDRIDKKLDTLLQQSARSDERTESLKNELKKHSDEISDLTKRVGSIETDMVRRDGQEHALKVIGRAMWALALAVGGWMASHFFGGKH